MNPPDVGPPDFEPPSGPICDLEPFWVSEDREPSYRGTRLALSPAGDLLLSADQMGAGLHRTADGQILAHHRRLIEGQVDAQWQQAVVRAPEVRWGWRVIDLRTGDLVLETDEAPEAYQSEARLSASGDHLLVVDCAPDPMDAEQKQTHITRYALPGGAVDLEATFGSGCDLHVPEMSRWVASAEQDLMLQSTPTGVARITADGETRFHDFEWGPGASVIRVRSPEEPQQGGWPPPSSVSLTLSPDGRQAALVGPDGVLRLFDARTLEPVAPDRPVALVLANDFTFLPSVESPVAFLPGRNVLAHLDAEGQVVLTDRTSGELIQRLDFVFEAPDPEQGWGHPDTPTALLATETDLFVRYEGGIARWRCGGALAQSQPEDLQVRIEGPSRIRADADATFEVLVEGASGPIFRTLSIGDQPVSAGHLSPRVKIYPQGLRDERDRVTLRARVQTGASEAEATLELEIER